MTGDIVYVVYRQGFYMQGIVGIYSDEDQAKEAARRAKRYERDNYHTFKIETFYIDAFRNLNKEPPL